MDATKPTSRTRLLETAYTLMLKKGYPSTAVDEICETAGVSKGSFYHSFKSKEDLALAVLEYHMDGAAEAIEEGLELEGLSGPQRAIRYVKHVEDGAEELWSDGCLIGSFALELAETHPEIRWKVSKIFRDLEAHMEKVFEPLCEAHPGPKTPSARELAEQFLVVIEGGVVLSRAHQDRRYVPRAIRGFRHYLEQLVKECE